jgi:hypothetical protein
MNGRRLTIGLATVALIAPVVLYVSAYFLLVRRGTGQGHHFAITWSPEYSKDPFFSMQAYDFFRPIHGLDRKWLRPAFWHEAPPWHDH